MAKRGDGVPVILSWPWTGTVHGGTAERQHKADDKVVLDPDTARDLIRRGLARPAEEKTTTAQSEPSAKGVEPGKES